MSEFGHTTMTGAGVHVDIWGSGPFEIKIGGKRFRFEDSDRFGPLLLNRHDEPRNNQDIPAAFYAAYEKWRSQGRRTAPDGRNCLWSEG